jgi:integrase
MVRYVYPLLGGKQIDEITVADVRSVLQRIDNLGSTTVAPNVLNEISHVFRFAVARELVQFDIAAGLRGSLPPIKTKHRAAVTDPKRIGELLRALDSFSGNTIIKLALRLLALTFVRSGELRKASWSEIDLENSIWRIPAERMKMRRPHIVPLSRQAVEAFTELHEYTGFGKYIFPALQSAKMGNRPLSDVTLLSSLRRLGYSKDEMTIHGFRSLASTALNEQGYNRDWIERQLAHSERNGVRASYDFSEHLQERRRMMQEYADFLDVLRDAVPSQ